MIPPPELWVVVNARGEIQADAEFHPMTRAEAEREAIYQDNTGPSYLRPNIVHRYILDASVQNGAALREPSE
jgi:hypothetical protein